MQKKRELSRSRDPMQLSNATIMTLPDERYRAVIQTEKFLKEILSTPRVPKAIKDRARSCLRHYPVWYDMQRAAEAAPDVFQEQMEDLHRFVAAGSRAAQEEDIK